MIHHISTSSPSPPGLDSTKISQVWTPLTRLSSQNRLPTSRADQGFYFLPFLQKFSFFSGPIDETVISSGLIQSLWTIQSWAIFRWGRSQIQAKLYFHPNIFKTQQKYHQNVFKAQIPNPTPSSIPSFPVPSRGTSVLCTQACPHHLLLQVQVNCDDADYGDELFLMMIL